MSNDARNQPTGEAHPPPPSGGLIPSVVDRIDEVRNRILDWELGDWESFRTEIDRELRDISLTLVSACPPA